MSVFAPSPEMGISPHGPATTKAATHSVVIPRPAGDVYRLVTDFASYPRFVPNMSQASVLREGDHGWRVAFEVSAVGTRVRYTLDLQGEPPGRIRWQLVDSNFLRTNVGGWVLEPLADGGTHATCWFEVQLRGFIPKALTTYLMGKTLPKNLEAFKQEALRRC
jgi:ribosome-associated toxin RatA of RatAB toxin-antitoxin module